MKYIKKYGIIIIIVLFLSVFINPAIAFFIFGSLIVYFGIAAILFLKKIQNSGIETTGTILSFESDSEGYKTPFIEFTPTGGELIREKPFAYASTDLSKIRSYKSLVDKQVSILYDPDDPKKFILADEKGFNYFVFGFFILVGSGFITVSICSFLGYIKLS